MKMKDGRTHLGYKVEHLTDLDSEIIIQATVCHSTEADPQTIVSSLVAARVNLDNCLGDGTTAESGTGVIEEVAADKGYHANEVLKACTDLEIRTCIPEREGDDRKWDDKEEGMKEAFHGNRQRMKRSKGETLQRFGVSLSSEASLTSARQADHAAHGFEVWTTSKNGISSQWPVTISPSSCAACLDSENPGRSRPLTAFSAPPVLPP